MRRTLWLLVVLLLGAACQPQTLSHTAAAWQWADLRALDPAENIPPSGDITALYLRRQGADLQIRLDVLDFSFARQSDFLLTLRDNADFAADPLQIFIPATGTARIVERASCTAWIIPRVQRDPTLDTITITLRGAYLGSRLQVTAISLGAEQSQPYDIISGQLDGTPPDTQAHYYLAFYHVLRADTPAQILRSWDGAHSGPRGERHGLRHLLQAAERHQVPLILLNARDPRILSALDLIGEAETLRQGQARGQLILPVVRYLLPPPAGWQDAAFSLPASPFIYAPYAQTSDSRWQFVPLADFRHAYQSAGKTYFPLPDEKPEYRLDETGLPLPLRRALVNLAQDSAAADTFLALGGDLTNSNWGTAGYAERALAWLAARPYLQPLDRYGLQTFPARPTPPPVVTQRYWQPPPETIPDLPDEIPVSDLFRVSFGAALNAPHTNLALTNLQLHAQVLQMAAAWQKGELAPGEHGNLYALTQAHYLAIIDWQHGRLLYLFARSNEAIHQIIAPSSQLAIGLSDPREWQPTAGWQADPQTLFSLDDGRTFRPLVQRENFLYLFSHSGSKTFLLDEEGLHVQLLGQPPAAQDLVLIIDPWERFQPNWAGQHTIQATDAGWQLSNGHIRVEVRASGTLEAVSWRDTLSLLPGPEDPNYNYPRGHYLPIPLTLLRWQPDTFPATLHISQARP